MFLDKPISNSSMNKRNIDQFIIIKKVNLIFYSYYTEWCDWQTCGSLKAGQCCSVETIFSEYFPQFVGCCTYNAWERLDPQRPTL